MLKLYRPSHWDWRVTPRKPTRLAADLAKRFPEDTIVQSNYLPTIHAATALQGGSASKAIEALAPVAPYELGSVGQRSLPRLPAWRGLSGSAPRQRSRSRVSENSRPPRRRREQPNRRAGALRPGPRLHAFGRQGQSPDGVSGLPRALERRRSRHPHPASKPRPSTQSCSNTDLSAPHSSRESAPTANEGARTLLASHLLRTLSVRTIGFVKKRC